MIVIGITGKNCAGKDATADVLESLGFERHSLSDALRAELRARDVPVTREALIDVGVELREAEGPAVLAERMLGLLRTQRVCLVSIRSPAEVHALRRLDHFHLLAVEAPASLRFERERARHHERQESVPPTLDAFLALDERENTLDENAQQLDAAIDMADETILNEGDLDELRAKVLALLESIDG
jgi:dephospho-CoA kinase